MYLCVYVLLFCCFVDVGCEFDFDTTLTYTYMFIDCAGNCLSDGWIGDPYTCDEELNCAEVGLGTVSCDLCALGRETDQGLHVI